MRAHDISWLGMVRELRAASCNTTFLGLFRYAAMIRGSRRSGQQLTSLVKALDGGMSIEPKGNRLVYSTDTHVLLKTGQQSTVWMGIDCILHYLLG